MSDKNEFARCVPTMFQESAVNWLLDKLSAELEEYRLICVENPDRIDWSEDEDVTLLLLKRQATLRASAVKQTLLALFSDKAEEFVVGEESEPISISESIAKLIETAGVGKCHTGSR